VRPPLGGSGPCSRAHRTPCLTLLGPGAQPLGRPGPVPSARRAAGSGGGVGVGWVLGWVGVGVGGGAAWGAGKAAGTRQQRMRGKGGQAWPRPAADDRGSPAWPPNSSPPRCASSRSAPCAEPDTRPAPSATLEAVPTATSSPTAPPCAPPPSTSPPSPPSRSSKRSTTSVGTYRPERFCWRHGVADAREGQGRPGAGARTDTRGRSGRSRGGERERGWVGWRGRCGCAWGGRDGTLETREHHRPRPPQCWCPTSVIGVGAPMQARSMARLGPARHAPAAAQRQHRRAAHGRVHPRATSSSICTWEQGRRGGGEDGMGGGRET